MMKTDLRMPFEVMVIHSVFGAEPRKVALEAGKVRGITKTATKTITKEDAAITKDDWAVLQIIRENSTVTAEEIGDKLGLTRAGAIYHINKLRKITKIRRVGTPRNGHWEVL